MRILTVIALLCSTALGATSELQTKIAAMAAAHHGKVAFYAKNLKTGETVAVDADAPVQTASVIKLPIMLEAMYQAKSGKLDLSKRVRLTKENQVPGSGVLAFLSPGLELTVDDVITLMITLSDNTATNVAIDVVGLAQVNKRIESLGLKNTWLYKKVYKPSTAPMPPDQKKFGLGKTTAREMAAVMESIARCDLHDAALCGRMLEIMRHQQYRNMIPRMIETVDVTETPSAICDKIGQLDDVRNDVALVFTKNGTLVISAFTYENKDQSWIPENEAELLIARMSKMVMEAWAPQGLRTGEPLAAGENVGPKPHD